MFVVDQFPCVYCCNVHYVDITTLSSVIRFLLHFGHSVVYSSSIYGFWLPLCNTIMTIVITNLTFAWCLFKKVSYMYLSIIWTIFEKNKLLSGFYFILIKEEFEDTKGVIRNRKSKKNMQCIMISKKNEYKCLSLYDLYPNDIEKNMSQMTV